MTAVTLQATGVAKAFRSYVREYDRVLSWVGLNRRPVSEKWVLSDVTMSVAAGEAVGLVGQNGAGKSTLLKIITGTLRPTRGSIGVSGRVAAILELGLGFNPEFTGRENAYHAAGLLGHAHDDIVRVMPEIAAFAEIGGAFDEPLRTYSSGMQMRVAFATVTAFRPDILIVDEALAVGDTYFQHKSLERIRDFKRMGTTLLLVSHDASAIQSICDRVVLLKDGRVHRDGSPADVLDYYNALMAARVGADDGIRLTEQEDGRTQTVSGSGEARIESVRLTLDGADVDTVPVGATVVLTVRVRAETAIPRLVIGYAIKNRLGQVMYGTNTHHLDRVLYDAQPGETFEMKASFVASLGPGSYSFSIALHSDDKHLSANFEWRDLALLFNVVNAERALFDGLVHLPPTVAVARLSADEHAPLVVGG